MALEAQVQERNVSEPEKKRKGSCTNKVFHYLFWTYTLLIALLVIALTIRGVLSARRHNFNLKSWYVPVLSSTACASIIAFAWQEFARRYPSRTMKAAFWLSPLFTCGFGILLVLIGTPVSLAMAVITLISSVFQSLYACWVSPRFEHANKILTVSIKYHPQNIKCAAFVSILICTIYSSFMISGIGGATVTRTEFDILFIFLILASLTWTMQIVKNMIQVIVSHIKYLQFASGMEIDFNTVINNACKYSFGSICIGSVLIPVISVVRGLARAVNLVSGDVDEFMFSCADCCSGFESSIVEYGNRWGFLHVGVYNKGIVQASMDTWEIFRRVGMEKLINSDLTSSFCFLCGVASGSACALVGASWALVTRKKYATEIAIYTFLIGYFMTRVAMAWVQASVTAYYVAYAENPQNQEFGPTIPDYIKVLERSQV